MGEKKKNGKTGALRAKSLFTGQKVFDYSAEGAYILPSQVNYKKKQNQKLLQGVKWEEN